jgi:hypothetical protein
LTLPPCIHTSSTCSRTYPLPCLRAIIDSSPRGPRQNSRYPRPDRKSLSTSTRLSGRSDSSTHAHDQLHAARLHTRNIIITRSENGRQRIVSTQRHPILSSKRI